MSGRVLFIEVLKATFGKKDTPALSLSTGSAAVQCSFVIPTKNVLLYLQWSPSIKDINLMDTSTLVTAATNAQSALTALWDSMGVPSDERNSFLSKMSANVSSIYASSVAGQTERKIALEAEIITLQTTIRDMRVSMEEPGLIVRREEVFFLLERVVKNA